MVKICPKCGTTNEDISFWCNKCGIRLIKNPALEKDPLDKNKVEKQTIQVEDHDYPLPYDDTLKKRHLFYPMVKIPIAIFIIAMMIFASIYFISNIGVEKFNWDRFGGCPWDQDFLPWDNSDFPWVQGLDMDNIYNSWEKSHDFTDIGEINDDYWFEGDKIITNLGWTFTISTVKDCIYTGKILEYYVYNKDCPIYQPSELFSQVDIFFGFDDIIGHPEKYPYKVESYFYRGVYVRFTGSEETENYFYNHVTNTHLIPHTKEILNKLKTIDIGDIVSLNGSFVDVVGRRENSDTTYHWNTDTNVGDSNCEIILINSITIS